MCYEPEQQLIALTQKKLEYSNYIYLGLPRALVFNAGLNWQSSPVLRKQAEYLNYRRCREICAWGWVPFKVQHL